MSIPACIRIGAVCLLAGAIGAPARANLVDCGINGNNQITAYCGEGGIPLRVKINNSPPNNPNANYVMKLGIGVGSGTNVVRQPTITNNTDPPQCVATTTNAFGPLGVERCPGASGAHTYHTTAPKSVPYNAGQPMTLATVNIDGICPGACELTVPIDYYFEGPDPDDIATWDTSACTFSTPPTLTDPLEALQPRLDCVFEIKCIEKPPARAQGQGPASGENARAYTDDEWAPGTTRVSLDLRAAEPGSITEEPLEFRLGIPGDDLHVGTEAPDVLDWNQLHALLPTDVVDGYENAGGRLQYYVTTGSGIVLFVGVSEVPSASPPAGAVLALLLGATGAGWMWWRKKRTTTRAA